MNLWLLQHLPVATFIFAAGAIVGSFINVVIYRLPAGMSVISPPSRCPTCGARLSWRENLPILGWFLVRGRCRHCAAPVSCQYMLVELIVALFFVGFYAAYYAAGPRVGWWGAVGGDWWYYNWVARTSPLFVAHLALLAALVAMTVIDARTYIIPIQIPLVVTVVAFLAHPLQALLPAMGVRITGDWPVPAADWQWFAAVCGGMAGIGFSVTLLKCGVLRYSFADYDTYVAEGDTLAEYPHARREMGVEILFLLPCLAGITGGLILGAKLPTVPPPVIIQALGGVFGGYLAGGGLIWGIRILGTLAFGREAMGVGDIHLLAAVGAVLGCTAPLWIFFVAPFSGLLWIAVSKGLLTTFKKTRRELPYGPHLAVATIAVIVCQPAINWTQQIYLPWLPAPGLVQTEAPGVGP